MLIISISLFILGLACGSFVNALVWRLHEQLAGKKNSKAKELSILNGRSMCPKCQHQLAWHDLIPVLSWLWLKGRCRYCKKPISAQYPIVELAMGSVFALSYLFWPGNLYQNGQWLLLATWLTASIGLVALLVYDLRWMILPNRIIYPALGVAVVGRAVYIAAYTDHPWHDFLLWALSLAIASGVFYCIFAFSKGKLIGFGDVRLGLITGTLLADPYKSLAMIFLASVLGTLAVVPHLLSGKKSLASKLPYGPFLIAATAVLVVFGDRLIDWYKGLFGL